MLCHHHGLDITTDWTFHVLPQDAIAAWPAQSLRPSTVIAAGYPALDGTQLADAIRALTG
ncbi:MAG: hypothetical protein O2815_04605 [Actinomycetota bacterium]|nr:hypothetical protein [Actinomycetota bacterium]